MTRDEIRKARDIVENALKAANEELRSMGYVAAIGRNATYDPAAGGKISVELNPLSDDGVVVTPDMSALQGMFGLPAAVGGKTKVEKKHTVEPIILNGREVVLTGYRPRSRKYPFIGREVATGKSYKYMAQSVQHAIDNAN